MDRSILATDVRRRLHLLTDERYELTRKLGHGSMATVVAADDTRLDRSVAIKILHRHLIRDPEHCSRFRREAESIARLDHPILVDVYDLLEEPGEFLAMVIEHVDGPSLRDLLEKSPPLPPELASAIIVPILEGLDHAHNQGVVHRDLKPANILFDADGRPRLTDFGIAHVVDARTLTDTGSILGSPAYMSPEAVDGEPIDHRTDLFSIGSILFLMVTGEPAFRGETPSAVMRNIAGGRPNRADHLRDDVGREFADIIDHLLETDRDERFSSAKAAADRLRQFIDETLDQAPDLGVWLNASGDAVDTVRHDVADGLRRRVETCIDDGDHRRGLPLVERLIALRPDDPDVVEMLDRLHDDSSPIPRVAAIVAIFCVVATGLAVAATHLVESESPPPPGTPPETDTTPPTATGDIVDGEAFELPMYLDDLPSPTEQSAATAAAHITDTATRRADDLDPPPPPDESPASEGPFDSPDEPPRDRLPSPDHDTEPDDEPDTQTLVFRVIPPSATLTVDNREIDAIEASRGIELTGGHHTVVADGPGAESRRESIVVDDGADTEHSIVLTWKDGYIRLVTDRDALVWLGDEQRPRSAPADEETLITVPFGPADKVDSRRDVDLRIAPRDNLAETRRKTVTVRPETETPLAVTLHDD